MTVAGMALHLSGGKRGGGGGEERERERERERTHHHPGNFTFCN